MKNLARAVERTVTYTVSSATAVATSGIAPSGSSAKFVNTCTVAKDQLTGSTKMTLTLSGYTGLKITGLILSMKSNTSSGAGYLDVKAGTTQLAAIGKSSAALGFNNAAWHGSWSTSYVNVNVSLTDASYVIQDNEDVVIVVGANTNSLYCRSFTLTYEEGPATPVLHTSHTSLSFGKVETGTDKQQSFTLSGHNLTADASLSVTGSDSEQFKIISPGVNFAPVEGTIAETDVTVTYAPTATGAHTATLTIASGEITSIDAYGKEVTIVLGNLQPAFGAFLPFVALLLTVLARRAIIADEKMVRAAGTSGRCASISSYIAAALGHSW